MWVGIGFSTVHCLTPGRLCYLFTMAFCQLQQIVEPRSRQKGPEMPFYPPEVLTWWNNSSTHTKRVFLLWHWFHRLVYNQWCSIGQWELVLGSWCPAIEIKSLGIWDICQANMKINTFKISDFKGMDNNTILYLQPISKDLFDIAIYSFKVFIVLCITILDTKIDTIL